MAWALLLTAGALEAVWALALKRSHGFTVLWPSLLGVTVAIVSLTMLTVALKHLPAGTAYAVWVGVGSVCVAVAGIALFGESAAPARLVCLGLIAGGVVGLKLLPQ
ncbi:SMR family transporter [Schlegelella sp. S2-27]|uniref:Guanidinium exporter n=1 Tax=Caldimonas mangrovi TaxID=2944811 RepID=A0ABT0YRQ8_9BURK|nr:SMR family transporter [Caldimonas mangrovi]MCM5681431.1 SMR family transporter [Caldimonas mangrovi]